MRKPNLPTINAELFLPNYSEIMGMASTALQRAAKFKTDYFGKIPALPNDQLHAALREYLDIQIEIGTLNHLADFYRLKWPETEHGVVKSIQGARAEALINLSPFLISMTELGTLKLEALATDPAFSEFHSILRFFLFRAQHVRHAIPQNKRELIARRYTTHHARLGRFPAADRYFRRTMSERIDSLHSGYENPSEYAALTNHITEDELGPMRKALETQKPIIREYTRYRKLLFHPTQESRYPETFVPRQVSWQAAREMALDTFTEISPRLGVLAGDVFERGLIEIIDRPYSFTAMSSPTYPPFVFTHFTGAFFQCQELCHMLGHAVGFFERTKTPEMKPFHSIGYDDIFPNLLERQFWKVMAQKQVPDLDANALALDNFVEFTIRYSMAHEFHQTVIDLCSRRDPWNQYTLDAKWGQMKSDWYGAKASKEQSQEWQLTGVHLDLFTDMLRIYGQLIGEKLWHDFEADRKTMEPKLQRFLEQGHSETPHDLLKVFGYDTKKTEFWESCFVELDEAVRQYKQQPPKADNIAP